MRFRFAAVGACVAMLAAAGPVFGQTWDTQLLVRDAGVLTDTELPGVRKRATEGDPRAQVLLGLAHEMGSAGLSPDSVQALAWFARAADQGIAWAKVWSGDFYYTGSPGVPKDLYKALRLYQSAADAGDPHAAFLVGQMFFFGDGPVANHREAAGWLRRAVAADPRFAGRMMTLAEAGCESPVCLSLRQLVGAFAINAAERYVGEWDEAAKHWDAVQELPHMERCGFTSTDGTSRGEIRSYFCDSDRIDDAATGRAAATQQADDVAAALPADWSRTEPRAGEAAVHILSSAGFPRIRVSYEEASARGPRVTVVIER